MRLITLIVTVVAPGSPHPPSPTREAMAEETLVLGRIAACEPEVI